MPIGKGRDKTVVMAHGDILLRINQMIVIPAV